MVVWGQDCTSECPLSFHHRIMATLHAAGSALHHQIIKCMIAVLVPSVTNDNGLGVAYLSWDQGYLVIWGQSYWGGLYLRCDFVNFGVA